VLGSDGSLQIWDLKKLRVALAQFGLDWNAAAPSPIK
jgi:hypothetical protein